MNIKTLKTLEYDKILNIVSNYAVSSEAKEKVMQITPSVNFDETNRLQEETEQASSMIVMHGAPPFSPVRNILPALKRTKVEGVLTLGELMAVGSVLYVVRRVKSYLELSEKFDILGGFAENLTPVRDLERDLSDAIISEETVADNASPQLAALRRKETQLNDKIKEILNNMIHSPSYSKYLQEPIVTMRGDRYVLPVKTEHKANVQGILHDSSATGSTVFIEPIAVVQTNNQLRDVLIAQEREIERIIKEFSGRVGLAAEILEIDYNTLIDLDVMFAKAGFSNAYKCLRPELSSDGSAYIKQGRHPLIDRKTVVPTDLYIGREFNTLVITGPNTGGKTVTLKTLGLLALMCQSGIHIPAEIGTRMPVYENIFADIGDEQSIEQSLSTFSSHMVNIADILNNIGPNTLALFDELGAGTDPDEGAALAIEILEYVRACGAKAVATTHYSELKMYALSTDGVENASCEFDVATLRPTYKLLIGVPGKSNAFAISKRLGIYDDIIEKAKKRMTAESVKFEDIINELQTKRDAAEHSFEESVKMKNDAVRILDSIKKEENRLKEKSARALDEARRQAREIIENAKEETNALMKEIRKISKESADKEQMRKMQQFKEELSKKSGDIAQEAAVKKRKSKTKASDIKPGMTVEVMSIDDKGTVVNIPNNNGDFQVQIGIIKIKTNVSDVKIVKDTSYKKAAEKVMSHRSGVESKSISVKTELDLRGFMAYDAVMELDKFIDDAVLASLPRVSVIHGKGTGALRNAVHESLRGNRLVKSYRLGSFGEGDTGVTIIELKD